MEIIERKMPKEIVEALRQNGEMLRINILIIEAWSKPPVMVKSGEFKPGTPT